MANYIYTEVPIEELYSEFVEVKDSLSKIPYITNLDTYIKYHWCYWSSTPFDFTGYDVYYCDRIQTVIQNINRFHDIPDILRFYILCKVIDQYESEKYEWKLSPEEGILVRQLNLSDDVMKSIENMERMTQSLSQAADNMLL